MHDVTKSIAIAYNILAASIIIIHDVIKAKGLYIELKVSVAC